MLLTPLIPLLLLQCIASTFAASLSSSKDVQQLARSTGLEKRTSARLLGHACRPIAQGVAVRTTELKGDNDYCILRNVNSSEYDALAPHSKW